MSHGHDRVTPNPQFSHSSEFIPGFHNAHSLPVQLQPDDLRPAPRQHFTAAEPITIESYRPAIAYILAGMDCGQHLPALTSESIHQLYCDQRDLMIAVAVSDRRQPVGYCIYKLVPHQIELCRIVVDAEWRGYGIGKRLFSHVIGKLDGRRRILLANLDEDDMDSLKFMRRMNADRVKLIRLFKNGPDAIRFIWDRVRPIMPTVPASVG